MELDKNLRLVSLGNVELSGFVSSNEYISELDAYIQQKKPSTTCFMNAHMFVESQRRRDLYLSISKFDFVCMDGVPLLWICNAKSERSLTRMAGMDVLPLVLDLANRKNYKICFIGGSENMMSSTRNYLQQNFPRVKDFNYYCPPFGDVTESVLQEVLTVINNCVPDIVFVVLGCPKQELLMSNISGKTNASVLAVGGALPVLIGQQRRAPVWMQKASLEWFYRLIQEPRRLFKRYFVTNSLFLFLILKQWLLRGRTP